MRRKGCIYSEITNAGPSTLGRGVRGTNKRIMKSRWVAEIMIERKLHRFRSTNYGNVSLGMELLDERMFGELEWVDDPMEVEMKPTKRKK